MHTSIILLLMLLRVTGGLGVDLSSPKENYYSDELVNLEIRPANKSTERVSYIRNTNNGLCWVARITNLTSGNELAPVSILAHHVYPRKDDFQILEPNEAETLKMSIDFNKLVIRPKEQPGIVIPYADLFTTEPDSLRYGKYRIKIQYYDVGKHRHAIDTFQTNEIVINYLKK